MMEFGMNEWILHKSLRKVNKSAAFSCLCSWKWKIMATIPKKWWQFAPNNQYSKLLNMSTFETVDRNLIFYVDTPLIKSPLTSTNHWVLEKSIHWIWYLYELDKGRPIINIICLMIINSSSLTLSVAKKNEKKEAPALLCKNISDELLR